MQDQEIIEYWGQENLIRFSPAEVADLALSSRSKSFLCEVGLPWPKGDLLWKHSYHFESGKLQRMPGRESCLYLSDQPRPIYIDEQRGGCVFMPSGGGDMERFVNSTVEQFGASLAISWRYQEELFPPADGNITLSRSIFAELKQKLHEVDPAALLDENAYWAVVLEDMWYPLMTDEELENFK